MKKWKWWQILIIVLFSPTIIFSLIFYFIFKMMNENESRTTHTHQTPMQAENIQLKEQLQEARQTTQMYQHKEEVRKSATDIHEVIKNYVRSGNKEISNPAASALFKKFLNWEQKWKPVFLDAEYEFQIAENKTKKIDLICQIGKRTIIVDIKTETISNRSKVAAKGTLLKWAEQLYAYQLGYESKSNNKIDSLAILHLDKGNLDSTSFSYYCLDRVDEYKKKKAEIRQVEQQLRQLEKEKKLFDQKISSWLVKHFTKRLK